MDPVSAALASPPGAAPGPGTTVHPHKHDDLEQLVMALARAIGIDPGTLVQAIQMAATNGTATPQAGTGQVGAPPPEVMGGNPAMASAQPGMAPPPPPMAPPQ